MRALPAGPAATTIGGFELVLELENEETTVLLVRRSGPRNFARWAVIRYVGPFGPAEHELSEAVARDLRRAANVSHPNVLPVHEVGVLGGARYVVTDYVEGCTIAELLRAGEPLSLPVALAISADVLAGLEAIHTAKDGRLRPLGLTHGRLGATNVVVGLDGRARIADLGLTRAPRPQGEDAPSRVLLSTAPELFDGARPSIEADVYAAGLLLYEMLTGAHPHARHRDRRALRAAASSPLPLLSAIDERVPRALADALARAVSPDPAFRYRSADAFARALEGALPTANGAEPPRATPREVGAAVTARAARAVDQQKAMMQEWVLAHEPFEIARGRRVRKTGRSRRGRGVLIACGAVLLAASATALYVFASPQTRPGEHVFVEDTAARTASPTSTTTTSSAPPAPATVDRGTVVDVTALEDAKPTSTPSTQTKSRPTPRATTESLDNPYR
ncbi:MAG: serine/threonine-protein kinase [Polyangiaceae bacterium]